MDTEQAFNKSLISLEEKGFDNISEPEKVLAAVWAVEAEVNNGGFGQLFFNSAGDISFYAAKAFSAIGALKMAELAQEALSIFGESEPSRDWSKRQDQLAKFNQKQEEHLDVLSYQFTEYPDNVHELLAAYVKTNF